MSLLWLFEQRIGSSSWQGWSQDTLPGTRGPRLNEDSERIRQGRTVGSWGYRHKEGWLPQRWKQQAPGDLIRPARGWPEREGEQMPLQVSCCPLHEGICALGPGRDHSPRGHSRMYM